MSNMTAQEVIIAAYRKGGLTVSASSTAKLSNGLQDLRNMLSSLSADGLVVPSYTTENFTLTNGQAVYTIGETGSPDFNTVRPLKITDAFIRVSGYDYPVKVNMTKSQYNALTSKDTEGRPKKLYYDPQYPLGKIKFDYEADTAYAFHMVSEKPLVNPASLATTFSISLPANEFMVYNLATRLAPDKNIKLLPQVFAIAESSMNILENLNALDKQSDPVTFDSAIVGRGGRSMDINTGE